jgi:excisionase family DNA binding protein
LIVGNERPQALPRFCGRFLFVTVMPRSGTNHSASPAAASLRAAGRNHHSPPISISTTAPSAPPEHAVGVVAAEGREPGLLTIREAAGVLRVSESTIRNAIGSGRLRAFRFGSRGGSIRIGRADLDDYMVSCATPSRQAGRATGRADGVLFKSLDAGRLLAAWRRQGVLGGRQEEHTSPSLGKDST